MAFIIELGECSRILPIFEAEPLSRRIPAQHGDEREYDQDNEKHDFSESCPEFGLPIPIHWKHVDERIKYDDESNGTSGRDSVGCACQPLRLSRNLAVQEREGVALTPILSDHMAGGDFERDEDGLEYEEVPSHCEAESVVDVAPSKADERARYRKVCHLVHHRYVS